MVPFPTVPISMVDGELSGSSGETGSDIRGVLERAVLMQLASGVKKKKKKKAPHNQICSSPAGGVSLVISLLIDPICRASFLPHRFRAVFLPPPVGDLFPLPLRVWEPPPPFLSWASGEPSGGGGAYLRIFCLPSPPLLRGVGKTDRRGLFWDGEGSNLRR